MTMTHIRSRNLVALTAIALSAITAVSCKQSDIDITNPNSALAGAVASDPTALQLLATGLLVDQRGTRTAQITNVGTFGREMYTYTPNEGRNTTHYLLGIVVGGQQKLDPSGFGTAAWQTALTALGASFLNANATTRAAFDVGVYDTYAPSPDSPNGLTQATNSTLYAHMSFQSDAQVKANGSPDDRYTAKIR